MILISALPACADHDTSAAAAPWALPPAAPAHSPFAGHWVNQQAPTQALLINVLPDGRVVTETHGETASLVLHATIESGVLHINQGDGLLTLQPPSSSHPHCLQGRFQRARAQTGTLVEICNSAHRQPDRTSSMARHGISAQARKELDVFLGKNPVDMVTEQPSERRPKNANDESRQSCTNPSFDDHDDEQNTAHA